MGLLKQRLQLDSFPVKLERANQLTCTPGVYGAGMVLLGVGAGAYVWGLAEDCTWEIG